MSEEFRIEQEVKLPATPEQVWDAVTRDIDAWLMPGQPTEAEKLAWEPAQHYIVRQEAEGWFNQLEMTIEPRENGSFLRYVHSGIFGDDWENQYDGASKHTTFYLDALAQYLRHFQGRPFQHVEVYAPPASITPEALDAVRSALGITAQTTLGDSLTIDISGFGETTATVDFHNEYFIGLRTDDALIRVFGRNHFGAPVAVGIYHYGIDPAYDESGAPWQRWLGELYAS